MDTPERRTKLLEIIWDHAFMAIEGPDNQGEAVDAGAVWDRFKEALAELGLELDVRVAGGGTSEPEIPKRLLTLAATGKLPKRD